MKLSRRRVRCSQLLPMCKKARIDKQNICGIYFCYCYGMYDASNDEPLEECKKCKAWNQFISLFMERSRQKEQKE